MPFWQSKPRPRTVPKYHGTMYFLRTPTGDGKTSKAVASFDSITASEFITNIKGHWETRTFVSGVSKQVFVFDEEIAYTLAPRSDPSFRLQVYVDIGSYLVPAEY